MQDVLWVCQALVDREVASQGQLQHPQPLLRVLMPLLYVLQGAHNPHERHLLAAVLRYVFVSLYIYVCLFVCLFYVCCKAHTAHMRGTCLPLFCGACVC